MTTTKDNFLKAFESGLTYKEMAKKFNVSEGTIKNYLKKLGLSRGKGNRRSSNKAFNF